MVWRFIIKESLRNEQIVETQVASVPAPAKIESQEDILKDIRELLKKQVGETEEIKPDSQVENK